MNKLWKYILFVGIVGLFILSTIYIFICNINFRINGNNYITLKLNQKYNDEGAKARVFNIDIGDNIRVYNDLDISNIGIYNIRYNLSFLGYSSNLVRKVEVIDDVVPSIKLNGDKDIKLYVGDKYIEEGAVAHDNYDGDITKNIKIVSNVDTSSLGNYQVVYSISDSSGNTDSVIRNVLVLKSEEVLSYSTVNNDVYNINDPIVKYIKERGYDVSLGYYNLVTGKKYFYQENKIYYGASLIKTLDAIYLYDKDMINDSLRPYIEKAISVSDNDSHFYLVNYIGKDNLMNYGIGLGASNTLRGSDFYYGNTTVKDQLVYMKKLYDLSKNNDELKKYFINDYANYIKVNGLTTMHKYGYYGQYFHDVGIIFDKSPYIIIVLTNHGNGNYDEVINDISNLMNKYHNGLL